MKYTERPKQFTPERTAIIGFPGTGKTTLAVKLSEAFNVIFLDTENDRASINKLPIEWQGRINYIGIPDSAAVPMAADTLLQLFKTGSGKICHVHGKYSCPLCVKNSGGFDHLDFSALGPRDVVILNTGSQLSASILAHVTRAKPVDYKPERDDWGSLRKFTEFFASQWQAADYNLVVIFHAIEAELEDKRKKFVPAFGSAGMSTLIGGKFDNVIYTDVVNKKFKAYSSATHSNNIETKSRNDFRIEDLAEPSLIPLYEKCGEGAENGLADVSIGSCNNASSTNATAVLSGLSAGEQSMANLKAKLGGK